MKRETLNEIIDRILNSAPENKVFYFNEIYNKIKGIKEMDSETVYNDILHLILKEELIERRFNSNSGYILTEKGREIKILGGYLNFIKITKRKKQSLKYYNYTKDFLPIIISIVALFFSLKEDKEPDSLIIDKIKILEERQKELDKEYLKEIDSLYYKINKLKK